MNRVTLYTVPDCPDCAAMADLLRRRRVSFTFRNVRGDPAALAEMQAQSGGVRVAPVTVVAGRAFFGCFAEQVPGVLAALQALEAQS